MEIIVHQIRLFDIAQASEFEEWVLRTDYATCPALPSVRQFSVQKVSDQPDAPVHYFEIITVTSSPDFERDMALPAFAALVRSFAAMAEVVGELSGTRLGEGYWAA